MAAVRLILAEKSAALRKVLQAGLEQYEFSVTTAHSFAEVLEALAQPGVQALLLDGELVQEARFHFDPGITLILMDEATRGERPYLWIRKPFDPALLAHFLRGCYRHCFPTIGRRRQYRTLCSKTAVVLVERTGECTFTELVDVSEHGCCMFHPHGARVGDLLQVLLRPTQEGRAHRGIVRNARLLITVEGELRRGIGVEFLEDDCPDA